MDKTVIHDKVSLLIRTSLCLGMALFIVSIGLFYCRHRARSHLSAYQKSEFDRQTREWGETVEQLRTSRSLEGMPFPALVLPTLTDPHSVVEVCAPPESARYSLIVYFSDVSCNTCVDTCLRMVEEVFSAKKTEVAILGVGHSSLASRLYSFIRASSVTYPFLYDGNRRIGTELNLHHSPVCFLIDNESKLILKAYRPSTSRQTEVDKSFAAFLGHL